MLVAGFELTRSTQFSNRTPSDLCKWLRSAVFAQVQHTRSVITTRVVSDQVVSLIIRKTGAILSTLQQSISHNTYTISRNYSLSSQRKMQARNALLSSEFLTEILRESLPKAYRTITKGNASLLVQSVNKVIPKHLAPTVEKSITDY